MARSVEGIARRLDLDGLRGVAVLLIIFLHYISRGFHFHHLGPKPLALLLDSFWAGVDIFFVLSGFLIGGIVLDYGRTAGFFRVFYTRRALRIFPVALLAIAFAYLILPLLVSDIGAVAEVPPYAYLLFINNLWTANGFHEYPPLGTMWSLAIEEQFYLIAPVLLLLAGERMRTVTLLAIVAISPGLRLLHSAVSAWDFTPFRLDGLAAGLLVAGLVRDEQFSSLAARNKRSVKAIAVGLVAAALLFAMSPQYSGHTRVAFGVWLNSLSTAAVLFFLNLNRDSVLTRVLSQQPLVALGRLSYFLYLMHMPILMCIFAIQGVKGPTQLLLALSLSVGAAWLSWRFVEGPLIALGKRISYGRAGAPESRAGVPSRVTESVSS